MIAVLLSSCNNSSYNALKSNDSTNKLIVNLESDDANQEFSQKGSNKQIKNDCIFDLSTQTDDFIKNIPEFSNYVWNHSTKTGVVTLDGGEKLTVKRGGCNHFEVLGQWIQKNRNHTIADIDFWVEQGKWISSRILTDTDYSELDKMISERHYDLSFEDDTKLRIDFEGHSYSEWYLSVNLNFKNGNDNAIVETGYYFE